MRNADANAFKEEAEASDRWTSLFKLLVEERDWILPAATLSGRSDKRSLFKVHQLKATQIDIYIYLFHHTNCTGSSTYTSSGLKLTQKRVSSDWQSLEHTPTFCIPV